MEQYTQLKPESVFRYFSEIAAIPHGSENMKEISAYCLKFAQEHALKAQQDDAGNVIIWKEGTAGYQDHAPVILQGHLDMVCQKTEGSSFDFARDGLQLYVDGDFLKAADTTLGADNGIAVAMILSILADTTISHPPIEAVFTTDEEIGMVGAGKLDFSQLKGRRMINLDAEEQDVLTVSCAGGCDFRVHLPLEHRYENGTKVTVYLRGLKGGHSGVEIHKGRVNGGILAGRVLHALTGRVDFSLLSICGGDKGNAIIPSARIELVTKNVRALSESLEEVLADIQKEILGREPSFKPEIVVGTAGEYTVFTEDAKKEIIHFLHTIPNGVLEMSAEIDGLVETSLNLGVLQSTEQGLMAHITLRSNKQSALLYLEERLVSIAAYHNWNYEVSGNYPPWEFKEDSQLQSIYKATFLELFGYEPAVAAIHAGLECGIFAHHLKDLDCIAVGPWMYDVHTVHERLSISSTQQMYALLLRVLEKM